MKRERTPIQAEIDEAHESLVAIFADFGVALDYSVESLKSVEDYIEENYPPSESNRWPAVRAGIKLFYIGAYAGEALRRKHGGEWAFDEKDPLGQIRAELRLADGRTLRPIEDIMERVESGRKLDLLSLAEGYLS